MAYAPMPVTESHRLREADDDGARRSLLSPTIASLALFGAVGLLATRHFGTTTLGSTAVALVECWCWCNSAQSSSPAGAEPVGCRLGHTNPHPHYQDSTTSALSFSIANEYPALGSLKYYPWEYIVEPHKQSTLIVDVDDGEVGESCD